MIHRPFCNHGMILMKYDNLETKSQEYWFQISLSAFYVPHVA